MLCSVSQLSFPPQPLIIWLLLLPFYLKLKLAYCHHSLLTFKSIFFVAINSHLFSKHISLFCLSSLSILKHCCLILSHTSLYLPLKYPWGQNSIPVPFFLFFSPPLASLPSPRAPSLVYMTLESLSLPFTFLLSPNLKFQHQHLSRYFHVTIYYPYVITCYPKYFIFKMA